MKRLLRTEFYRLFRSRGLWLILLVLFLCPAFAVWIGNYPSVEWAFLNIMRDPMPLLLASAVLAGVTVSGDTYADVELSSRMIRDLGGSIAMLAEDIPVRVSYRSNDNTTLLPSSAVRGAGDDRYVYTVQQTQSAFGVNSLVTQKQSVTVLAEAEGTVSVAEDLSYMQIAYMEDREIGENTTVMEYVN